MPPLPPYLLKTHLTIILPSTPRSSNWFLSHRFPHQNSICTSALPQTCTRLLSRISKSLLFPSDIKTAILLLILLFYGQTFGPVQFQPLLLKIRMRRIICSTPSVGDRHIARPPPAQDKTTHRKYGHPSILAASGVFNVRSHWSSGRSQCIQWIARPLWQTNWTHWQ